ncbi:MAG TPA: hypothetical protein VNL71_17575 [Chloroflexota bacterium]|nr:hypothetical protein [Chloroflexota bacterium]
MANAYTEGKPAKLMEPSFFSRDLTSDELSADLTALKLGRYPGWRLVGEVAYETGARIGECISVYKWARIWVRDPKGGEHVVTLRRPDERTSWRRVANPGVIDQ